MSYTLHQLDVFASVARNKSMTKAAEELYMTQPAVSIQVKKLQEHFGIKLFEVIGKQLHLTEAGQELYESQKNIREELNALEMAFSEIKGMLRGKLHVAVVSTAKYFMPYILGAFSKKYPEIQISLKVSDRIEVTEQLKNNECDLAVYSQLPEGIDLQSVEFLENPLHIAAPQNFELAGEKEIPFKSLEKYNFVNRETGSGTRMVMERLFKEHKIQPNIVMELSTNEAVKQAILAGIGISLISKHSYTLEQEMNRISILDIKELPYVNTWKLVYPKGKKPSPASRNFIEFTTSANLKDIIPQ